jgi:hypothetical protein
MMKGKLWDPKTRLRLAEPNKPGETMYFGEARGKFRRCTWTISEKYPEQAAATEAMVSEIAPKAPNKIIKPQMEDLVKHCLCDFHNDQVPQVMEALQRSLMQLRCCKIQATLLGTAVLPTGRVIWQLNLWICKRILWPPLQKHRLPSASLPDHN